MKKAFFILALFCAIPAFAGALSDAQARRDGALAGLEKTSAKIAKERIELNAKIAAASGRARALEEKLGAIRASRTDFDFALKTAAQKASQFDLLRANCARLAANLEMPGALPMDFGGFAQALNSALQTADKEIFSAKILEKALVETPPEEFLKAMESGEEISVKFDPSLGRLSKVKTRTLLQKIEAGGVWIYPILFFGTLALAIAVFKTFGSLSMGRFKAQALQDINSALARGELDNAKKIAAAAPKPYNMLLEKFLQNYGISKSLTEEIAYEQMLSCGEKLFSGLGAVSITASICPLLGLLGTVTGIIKTFGDLSVYGAGSPQLMSGGISEALITTEFGLMVAIPAFVVYAALSRRAKAILSDMEKISSEYISKNCK